MFAGPLAGRTVTRILCTHFHPDHLGLAGWLADRMSRRQEAADDLAYGDWPAVPTFRDTDITKFAHPHPASIAEEGR